MQGQQKRLSSKVPLIMVFMGQILHRDSISERKIDNTKNPHDLHRSYGHRSQEKFIHGI